MGAKAARTLAQPHPNTLIDTDILIDHLRCVQDASRFLVAQRQHRALHTSIICAMELVAGCGNSRDLRIVQILLSGFTLVPIESAASVQAYELLERFFLSHRLMIADALIGASAIHNGMTLYSKNVRDFQIIPGVGGRAPVLIAVSRPALPALGPVRLLVAARGAA